MLESTGWMVSGFMCAFMFHLTGFASFSWLRLLVSAVGLTDRV